MAEPVQEEKRLAELTKAVQSDWEQREFIEITKNGIIGMYSFLHAFELATQTKIAAMDSRLSSIEKHLELLEKQVLPEQSTPMPAGRTKQAMRAGHSRAESAIPQEKI